MSEQIDQIHRQQFRNSKTIGLLFFIWSLIASNLNILCKEPYVEIDYLTQNIEIVKVKDIPKVKDDMSIFVTNAEGKRKKMAKCQKPL